MKAHPVAEIFPLMTGAEFDALVADIKEHGQRDPIVLLDGVILDGRNRYRACETIGIPPVTANWDGNGSPEAFVVSHNLHRRHLNESQRALIGARLATRKRGGIQPSKESVSGNVQIQTLPVSQMEAAALLNVSRTAVSDATTVLRGGEPEEIAAIERGEISVNRIVKQIRAGVDGSKRVEDRQQSKKTGDRKRQATREVHGQIWAQFKEAMINLTGLPAVDDAVRIVRGMDRTGFIDKKLETALNYLKDFSDAWNNRDEA